MLNYFIDRLSEKSTWLGLTAFATAGGINVAPEMMNAIISAGVGIAGLIGVATKEKREQ